MKPYYKSYILKFMVSNKLIPITICFLLLLMLFIGSLSLGASSITIGDAWSWIFGSEVSVSIHNIMLHIRLPRTIATLLCGVSLAVSGLLLQSALNNPLASAGTIGINSGAGLFAILSTILFPSIIIAKPLLAFVGALFTAFLVFLIAKNAGLSRSAIVMAGVAIASLLSALTDTIVTIRPDSLVDKNSFFIGGFAHVSVTALAYAFPMVIIGLICAVLLATRLNLLALGDEVAASLGLSVNLCRYLALICGALLAAAAVCIGGLLGFVGLIVPHISRRIVGHDHKALLPFTALSGGSLVIGCDILARILFKPYEIPVGILLSILGAPFFLFLVLRRRRRGVL